MKNVINYAPEIKILHDPRGWDTGKIMRAASIDYEYGVVKAVAPDNPDSYYRWFDTGDWELHFSLGKPTPPHGKDTNGN